MKLILFLAAFLVSTAALSDTVHIETPSGTEIHEEVLWTAMLQDQRLLLIKLTPEGPNPYEFVQKPMTDILTVTYTTFP